MAAGTELRVVIADDQRVIRDGLELLLGLVDGVTVVGTAADGLEAVAAVAEHAPDVVLMDLRMPRCDGVEATRRVRAEYPGTQVVVLTTYADDADILAALRAGARGYLTKDAGVEEISRALRRVADGQADLDPEVQRKLLELIPGEHLRAPTHDLTEREVEVLRLVAQGLSNTDIAGRLFISEATVKTHINHIFAKAEVRDRAQAVAYAYRQGIV
ncbi:response regulator transcription factor [Longispora sp. K20-0274]|uniref:response regulator n=1 Tax=Longispora sp. K20-0274 TaxID=3088255 RepID=UPI00399A909F